MNTDQNLGSECVKGTGVTRRSIGIHLCLSVSICGTLLSSGPGCASAVAVGHSTALDAVDLQTMTDDMAAKMLADAEVQAAIAREGKLRVVVEPVENRMTAEILPRGPAEAYTARVRSLLSQRAPQSFTWVMNRDAWHSLRRQELDQQLGLDLGPAPESVNPRYALAATFSSLADESSKHRTSYYLARYELIDLESRDVLWTDKYEVKKTAVKGFLD